MNQSSAGSKDSQWIAVPTARWIKRRYKPGYGNACPSQLWLWPSDGRSLLLDFSIGSLPTATSLEIHSAICGNRAAGNPQQTKLRVGLGIERGEAGGEIFREPAGAEGADPGEAVHGVQAYEQRFRAAHRQSGDGP